MKPCEVYRLEVLADFVAGRLADPEAEALGRHLAACPGCRQAVARLGRLHDAMLRSQALAEPEVREDDHARIMRQVFLRQAETRRRPAVGPARNRSLVRIILTAAAAAVIIGGVLFLELKPRDHFGAEMARATTSRGKVSLNGRPVALKADEPLREGHVVETGADARVSIRLSGGALVDLNERTALSLEAVGSGGAICRLDGGQLYVDLEGGEGVAPLSLRTAVGQIVTCGAKFDLKITPRSVASRWPGRSGPLMLAAESPMILGNVGPKAELRLAVVKGEAVFAAAGDSTPYRVTAGMQLSYDPDLGLPRTRAVEAERYTCWRMKAEDLFALAQRHLPELFAGQAVALPGRRIRIDYDFLTSHELDDWRVIGDCWTLYRNALRVRLPGGEGRLPQAGLARIVSRAAFVGDTEVSYEVTVDPSRSSTVGWAFAYARDDADDAAVIGSAEVSFAGDRPVTVKLNIEDLRLAEGPAPSPGPVFALGGRIDRGWAYLSLADRDALDGCLPQVTQQKLYSAADPESLNVVVSAGGPDVFIRKLTVIGSPDPAWLRAALGAAVEKLDRDDR